MLSARLNHVFPALRTANNIATIIGLNENILGPDALNIVDHLGDGTTLA